MAYAEGSGGVKDTSFRVNHYFKPKFSTNLSITKADLPVTGDETIVNFGVSFRY